MPTKIENKHIKRFWGYVQKNATCWEWKGALARDYGLFRIGLKNIKAHRFVWMITNGSIPNGMCVLHHCDNKKCVNPKHLFLGTFADNNLDKCFKGRQSKLKGVDNPRSKLNNKEVIQIRNLYKKQLLTQKELAQSYGVIRQTITAIINRDNWGWL